MKILLFSRETFPHWTDDFFDYLRSLDGSQIKLYSKNKKR